MSPSDKWQAAAAKLEPEAAELAPNSDRAVMSIAISLKRIADAASSGPNPEVWTALNSLAWELGQAFERGRGAA
jgi:hypothetical protein